MEGIADLAEEVARFYGYNNIPTTLMRGQTTRGGYSPVQEVERTLGQTCRSLGYDEIITYSFISPTYYDKIRWAKDDPRRNSMKIMNPLGEDTSIMRTTVLPSMLEILARNYNFRNKSARLYELGRTYFQREDGMADEPKVLSVGGYGDGMDFFVLKGAVQSILDSIRVSGAAYEAVRDNPSYHPGRCAGSWWTAVRWAYSARSIPWWLRTTVWTRSSTARSCPLTPCAPPRGPIPSTSPCPSSPP